MHKRTKNRIILILSCLLLGTLGVWIILYNLEQHIVFFYPPSKINDFADNKEIRVGGLVKNGSIIRISANKIKFTITDNIRDLNITYQGILPALFRENQGVVARGGLSNDCFIATELLTKHDETYMPPELAVPN